MNIPASFCVVICVTLCMSLSLLSTAVLAACFIESTISSTCEPATSVTTSPNIRQCLRPDLEVGGGGGESVVWNQTTGSCVRRPTSCGTFSACSGRCLVPCDILSRGFLLFSIRTGVGVKSFELIDTPASSNGSMRSMPDASQLPGVFRANELDKLPSLVPLLKFKEMIVSLYVGNTVVMNLTFDLSVSPGTLNRTNWFSQANLKSSWPDTNLKNRAVNYFSIDGHTGATVDRRFFINYLYYGCNVDSSMMVALDKMPDDCSWSGSDTDFPKLMYNTVPRAPNLGNIQTADVLAIAIR